MGVKEITIPYSPRNWAKALHETTKRWICMVLHRRAGKTTAVVNHLQRDCIRTPKSQYGYIGPTYKQTKRIAWEIAKEISEPIPGTIPNESELSIKYPNGSKLFLAGSDNADSLRGISLWGGAGDEWQLQDPELFTKVISKCLADHLGYWIYLGTPNGKNHFYRTYKTALANPDDYLTITRTIDDSLAHEEGPTIQNLRQALEDDRKLVALGEITQEEFDQEWYCSWESAIKGAYYAKQLAAARREGRITAVPYDPALPVHTVWDLGVGRNMSIGFYQRSGIQTRMIDFWEGSQQEGIPQAITVVQRKPYVYGKHFAPHDVKATDMSTGKTRIDTARELGIDFEIVPALNVNDGITQGQLMFSHLWIDETKCDLFLSYLASYREAQDPKTKIWLGKPVHDGSSHAADFHRYAALVEDQMTSGTQKKSKWRR